MSAITSPPSAIITARSVRTRPLSLPGVNPRRATACDNAPVRPVLSARARSNTNPARDTTPRPPTSTDKPLDQSVLCTYEVPSTRGTLNDSTPVSFPYVAGTSPSPQSLPNPQDHGSRERPRLGYPHACNHRSDTGLCQIRVVVHRICAFRLFGALRLALRESVRESCRGFNPLPATGCARNP